LPASKRGCLLFDEAASFVLLGFVQVFFPPALLAFLNSYGSSGSYHHQHAATASYGFKIKIYSYYRIGAQALGLAGKFLQGCRLRFLYHSFVSAAAAAYYIAEACKNILENIGANNGFCAYHPKILLYGAAFYAIGGSGNHGRLFFVEGKCGIFLAKIYICFGLLPFYFVWAKLPTSGYGCFIFISQLYFKINFYALAKHSGLVCL
jgi:hypothetical protein